MVRLATRDDVEFLDQHDPLLTRQALAEKIGRAEVYVAEDSERPVGLARFNYFCDLDPCLTLIFILAPYRRRGFGSELMRYWEQEMADRGHRFVLTTTQADEDAQFFYRELGYSDTGSILFPGQAATELVLLKLLRKAKEGQGPRQKKRAM